MRLRRYLAELSLYRDIVTRHDLPSPLDLRSSAAMENRREETMSMVKEVRELQTVLRRSKALLQDAEQGTVEGESSKLLLQQLKDLVYDVEDVLGMFEYEELRYKVESSCLQQQGGRGEPSTTIPPPSPHPPTPPSFHYAVSFCRELAPRFEDIWNRRDDILKNKSEFAGVGDLCLRKNILPRLDSQNRDTSSLPVYSQVYGREEKKQELMAFIMAADDDGRSTLALSVVSIIGMGGIGKTTLARYVYNDEHVKNHFFLRMWVHVSPDFHLLAVTKKIVECAVIDDILGETQSSRICFQNFNNLDSLQKYLSGRLKDRRFLLVLDDVWEENYTSWSNLYAPLVSGERDSKILITARNGGVAKAAGSREIIQLDDLTYDDSCLVFKMHAFPYGDLDDRLSLLELIGKKIVKKLSGNPLALSTVGGMLRFESEENNWRIILESQLWELEQDSRDILPALRMSYEYLPMQLKPCFAYCCVFPKGAAFGMLELVQFWMAQGYLSPDRKMSMEDVGMKYLQELISRSLIQLVDGRCVIHDLVHDLGRLVLQNEWCEIGLDRVQEIKNDICSKRHLIFHCKEWLVSGELKVSDKFQTLRTLSFWFTRFPHIQVQLPLDLFCKLTYLRMLDLSRSALDQVPDSIGCLKSLKYLDLRETKIKTLPDSLCTLYKLQTLRLVGCTELQILPENMSHLISLHYLEATSELVCGISRIGNLRHLRNLEVFLVSKEVMNRIGELRYMNDLHGKLCIWNLNNVETKEEASEAALLSKKHLKILELVWASDRDVTQVDRNFEESIVEELQPPPQLKELTLNYYAGAYFPRWMSSSSILKLEILHLMRCRNLSSFQVLGGLNFLTTLKITSCPQLEELPQLPRSVKSLILRDVGLLALPSNLHVLPLAQLILCEIPRLEQLPPLPLTLKDLEIEDLQIHVLPDFFEVPELSGEMLNQRGKDQSNLHKCPQISVLKISICHNLRTLQEGFLKHHLYYLQVLSIEDCLELENWPNGEGFRAMLYSLGEEFTIKWCPRLKALPEGVQLHPSLKKLHVLACPRVINGSLYSQLPKFISDDMYVFMPYEKLCHLVDEALQHLQAIDMLHIRYIRKFDESDTFFNIYFQYDIIEKFNYEQRTTYKAKRVFIDIRTMMEVDDEDYKMLHNCLHSGYAFAPTLHELRLDHIPGKAFIGIQQQPQICLPTLNTLVLDNCLEMRALPMKTLLSHSPALKCLVIRNCPKLTLLALKEGILFAPSLEFLMICKCPKLLETDHHANIVDSVDDSSLLPQLKCHH